MRPDRSRRLLAVMAASLGVGLVATGCSWSGLGIFDGFVDMFDSNDRPAGEVTCGDWLDQSTEQRRDSVVDLIEDSDDDAVQDTLTDYQGEERDTFLDGIADFVTAECEGADPGAEIGQFVYEDY